MSILVDASTRVLVQGLTGSQGRFRGLRNRTGPLGHASARATRREWDLGPRHSERPRAYTCRCRGAGTGTMAVTAT